MKILALANPAEDNKDGYWGWEVEGELVVIPGACRATGDARTTLCVVRELDVSPADMTWCCLFSFRESGWDDTTFEQSLEAIAREIAIDAIEAAAEHPVGAVLRLTQGHGPEWQYRLEPAEACTR